MNQTIPAKQQHEQAQSPATHHESRKPVKQSARVAFGPDVETYGPPRGASPGPAVGHHRSFTDVDQKAPNFSTPVRPTSASGGESQVVAEPTYPQTSDGSQENGPRPPLLLKRTRSDYGPRATLDSTPPNEEEEDLAMRHGWQEEYTSSEYLKILHSVSC